jgi:hypothetical protein
MPGVREIPCHWRKGPKQARIEVVRRVFSQLGKRGFAKWETRLGSLSIHVNAWGKKSPLCKRRPLSDFLFVDKFYYQRGLHPNQKDWQSEHKRKNQDCSLITAELLSRLIHQLHQASLGRFNMNPAS